ncbi:hypothetical protein [Sinorhizobium meliloti]|uniref:hypothetical protein n=1 Tax=Rhizobium meliloti TaxID=382 RepID=UPI003DA0361C
MEEYSHEHPTTGVTATMVGSIDTNVVDGFTLVAVGDLIVSRPLTKGNHPALMKLSKSCVTPMPHSAIWEL